MKDIKQYFANGAKMVDEKVDVDSGNISGLQQDVSETTIMKKKRERVKIRISRTRNSKERTCDIIDNKNDLIDKTPSPFNAKANNNENTLQVETPKSRLIGLSIEQSLKKVLDLEINKKDTRKIM